MTRAPASFVDLAYHDGWGVPPGRHPAPCVLRCGVWAVVKNGPPRCAPAKWQVIHVPSGACLRTLPTRCEAVAVCRKVGKAFPRWASRRGFGAGGKPPPLKLLKIAGVKPLVSVG